MICILVLFLFGIYYFCAFCIALHDFTDADKNNIFKNMLLSLLWAFFATLFLPLMIIITPILWIYKIKENNLLQNLYKGFKGLSKKYIRKFKQINMFTGFTKEEIKNMFNREKKYGYRNNKYGFRHVGNDELKEMIIKENFKD